jgi:hypothetical protein
MSEEEYRDGRARHSAGEVTLAEAELLQAEEAANEQADRPGEDGSSPETESGLSDEASQGAQNGRPADA